MVSPDKPLTERYFSKLPKGFFDAKEDINAPLTRPEGSWTAALSMAQMALYVAWFGPLQILLGMQAAYVAPNNKTFVLSVVTGVGALTAMITNPLFGAMSDHTTSRYGRRAPWVLFGTVAGVCGLVLLAASWKPWAMVASWALVQASLNAAFAALNATPNDRILPGHRGEVSGWIGVGQNLGALVGAGLAVLSHQIVGGYVACITLLCALMIPYLFRSRDRFIPTRLAPYRMEDFVSRFWISPRKYPDFAWAWASRFLVLCAFNGTSLYLLYYLQDVIRHENPKVGVLVLVGTVAVLTMVVGPGAGLISDYRGRRRPLIFIGALLMAICPLMLSLHHSWTVTLLASIFLGLGHGCYVTVHFAISTQVLPATSDYARDLGIFNVSAALPQVAAPLLGIPLLGIIQDSSTGYTVLFCICAALFILGGLCIFKVQSVK